MSPPQAWCARHGETQWSADGRHTGATDVGLTPTGRADARAIGDRLRRERFVRVLTSPLARARETCRLAGFGADAEVVDDLREWDYGDYEGRTTADIRTRRPGWTVWRDGCPGGETAADVGLRADRVIDLVRGSGGDVLVFAHGHFLRVFASRWVGLPPQGGALLALDAGAVSALGWEREQPVVRRWNEPAVGG